MLDFLKGKCVINLDKFWTDPKTIIKKLKSHDMCDQVIVKSYFNEKTIKVLSNSDEKLPYMLMVKKVEPEIEKHILKNGVNLVAEELIFDNLSSEIISKDNVNRLKNLGLFSWINTIVYDYKKVISGGLTDDRAVLGEKDEVWGFFKDLGIDIIQTDWVKELSQYFLQDNQ